MGPLKFILLISLLLIYKHVSATIISSNLLRHPSQFSSLSFPEKFPINGFPNLPFNQQQQTTPIQNQGNQGSIQQQTGQIIPRFQRPLSYQDFNQSIAIGVLIFDNNREELCMLPRWWNGTKCACPNNDVYLSGKCYKERPKETNSNILSLRFLNRNFDGSQNNPRFPHYGARGNPLLRLTKPNYKDSKSQPVKGLPSPRVLSNLFGEQDDGKVAFMEFTNTIFLIWSQFIGNDITFTPTQSNESFNIPIPRCDKSFDKFCSGEQQLKFTRSIYQKNKQIRTNINTVSSWIDGSHIYGSDKKTADSLRSFKGGEMKVDKDNFLPKAQNGEFISGDRRVNDNIVLGLLHTIFVRQHNRICKNVTISNPSLTDEEVYQIARNYVIGLIQHITFDEWLPSIFGKVDTESLFGKHKYDPEADPSIFTEFQVGALKIFDMHIQELIYRSDLDRAQVTKGSVKFVNTINNSQLINSTSFPEYIYGTFAGVVRKRFQGMEDDLRNSFFTTELPNQKNDLFSTNIQRGRDHGVGSLKDIRQFFGIPQKSIKQTFFYSTPRIESLEPLYQSSDNIDLWVALISQKAQPRIFFGEIGRRLWVLQMQKIRDGDSLWYENSYPDQIIKQIKATSLRQIVLRNSNVKKLPRYSFLNHRADPIAFGI